METRKRKQNRRRGFKVYSHSIPKVESSYPRRKNPKEFIDGGLIIANSKELSSATEPVAKYDTYAGIFNT